MNFINGVVVDATERVVYIDGKEIPFHSKVQGNNISVINNKVFIDGYELINDEWKRTVTALYHKLF